MKIYLLLLLAVVTSLSYAVVNPTGKTWETLSLVTCSDGNEWTVCPPHLLPNTAPVISLVGGDVSYTEGDTYTELGATCTDTEDGSITVPAPSFSPTLNTNSAGTYVATYTCTDSGSLTDTVTRTVFVNTPPVGGGAITFSNSNLIPSTSGYMNRAFGAAMPDVNGDGCLDLYIASHSDADESRMYLHDNSGGVCQGTFTYFANNNNYTQPAPTTPRITSGYIFGNFYGHPQGFWSFYGYDVDGNGGARYRLDPSFTTVGGNPSYLPKTSDCPGSRPKCVPLDIDGDNVFEVVSRLYQEPFDTGYVYDQSGTIKYTSNGVNDQQVGNLSVFDVDNDGAPEVVSPGLRGYFEYDSVNSEMDWVASRFTGDVPGAGTTGNHVVPIDYDSDGDLDLYYMVGSYSTGGLATPYVMQNDGAGNFTNVTSTVLPGITLSNTAYHTTYGNSAAADIDNDGDMDIIYGAESFGKLASILVNQGNGTFAKDDSNDFTPSGAFGADNRRPAMQLGDFDNDGFIDLVHNGDSGTNDGMLYRNTTNNGNRWVRLRVRGEGTNTDGIGSRVTIFEPGTSNILTHQQVAVFSKGYQNLIPHSGTGSFTTVDIRVEYPHGGPTCNYSGVATNADYVSFTSCNIQSYTPGSAIPLTYVASNDVDTTVTLVADASVTPGNSELVTFGLPFAEGEVTSLDEITVKIGGSEVAAYVESTMTHHWSDNSIRSATIQLQNVDMTGGDVVVQITDEGSSVGRLTEQVHSGGWTTAGADKNNLQFPRIFAIHEKQYLADSGLIPPYDPAPDVDDAFETYQVGQFTNWAGGLDYSSSSNGNWLFDRSSAMFKAYMTTGRVEFLKEAFLSKQFYFTHVRDVGDPPAAAGGDGCFEYGTVACSDGKYIAPQQAKLALALVGDDSQWDNQLIINMALQADLGWNQYGTRDLFDSENEGFTERGAGLAGLAEVVAYEMTGDATILSHLTERITSLKDMQQTVKSWDTANGWTPKSGGFTHNIGVHEGVYSQASAPLGDTDERGFSAWMSENIADFLWQAYHITGNTDAPEMLRLLANAVEAYGFTTTYNTTTDTYTRRAAFTGQDRTQSCNTTGANTDHLYMASAYASDTKLASGDWWPYYSDNHNIETVLTLAAGYYFETNADNKEKLAARINEIETGWINANCALVFTNVYRLFNWQHRSNSIRTWKKILREEV